MRRGDVLGWVVGLIAAITLVSGAAQVFLPGFVLGLVGGEAGPAASHFFAIIGMFMALFGGLALHGLWAGSPPPLLWGALQKLGAAVAVYLAVRRDLLGGLALGVAGFDLLSGALYSWCWLRMANDPRIS